MEIADRNKYDILIVDDEPLIRESLYEILRIEGYRAHMAQTAEEALEVVGSQKVDIVLTDLKLPKMNGIELLIRLKQSYPEIEIVLITGYGTVETAVEAMKNGAYDYVVKPVNDGEIKIILEKVVEKKEILGENKDLREIVAETYPAYFGNMVGVSDKMQKVYHIIESVASSNATILVTGESGTGKGLVARAIHERDEGRKGKPFVEVSCGALSETLLESELFGHVKGAFTGAIKDKEGRFEFAQGGTIFLDEIDAFSTGLQVKLLRILQDGVFERVGDNVTRRTNARIVVATNKDLKSLVGCGDFREDLYYRVNVIGVRVPSLREKKEDIDLLVAHYVEKYSMENNKKVVGVSEEVRKLFMEYNWPGNIRELENAIEGAVVMAQAGIINKHDIPNNEKFLISSAAPVEGQTLKKVLESPERDVIVSALDECQWNRNRAAAALGINRTTLYNKMKKYNVSFNKPGQP
ncbi:MAG: sigma-54-dependent Fis family transcriptional regulator [Candidatus Omnitrophica bacterium]|nr:sigma-54-dependent Fis family transcriptional regulator [Candidatus Omnitrophota bacterium]